MALPGASAALQAMGVSEPSLCHAPAAESCHSAAHPHTAAGAAPHLPSPGQVQPLLIPHPAWAQRHSVPTQW